MTKAQFLTALRAELLAHYGEQWASDPEKLQRFMVRTTEMLDTVSTTVNIEGPAFVEAWRAIGGKGRPTYKALRALA